MMRVVRLLLYWVGAYVTLMAIFLLFGGVLDTLALPLRVLIVSAVLVVVMTQLVVPLVNRIIAAGAWLAAEAPNPSTRLSPMAGVAEWQTQPA